MVASNERNTHTQTSNTNTKHTLYTMRIYNLNAKFGFCSFILKKMLREDYYLDVVCCCRRQLSEEHRLVVVVVDGDDE